MASFEDGSGRTWVMTITGAEMIQMKRELGVNICKDMTSTDDDSIAAVLCDPERLIGCMWICLESQLDELNIDEMGFARLLQGDVLNSAAKAFIEAVSDFFPNPQQRRAVKALLGKGMEMGPALQEAIADKFEGMNVAEMVTDIFGSSLSGVESSASSQNAEPTAS